MSCKIGKKVIFSKIIFKKVQIQKYAQHAIAMAKFELLAFRRNMTEFLDSYNLCSATT
jgi:hypothetical protein